MERSYGRSGRRTSWVQTRWVRITELPVTTRRSWPWWRQCRRVWLIVRALLASLHRLHLCLVRRLLLIHGLALVALWWRWVLPRLLVWWRVRVAVALLWERLAVRAVELRVGRRVLATPDGMGGHEGLCLRADWREDAWLREALTVGAATVFGLIETRTANLRRDSAQSRAREGRTVRTYLASPAISTRYRRSLARCRLSGRVGHLRLLWVRRLVHLRRCRQRAVLIGVLRLQRLHRRATLRNGLRDGRHLL